MHGSYIFGTSAGLPTKDRNTQAIALNLEPYSNSIWLFDVGGDSTSNFASLDKIRQSRSYFYHAYAWRPHFWITWIINKSFIPRWRR